MLSDGSSSRHEIGSQSSKGENGSSNVTWLSQEMSGAWLCSSYFSSLLYLFFPCRIVVPSLSMLDVIAFLLFVC